MFDAKKTKDECVQWIKDWFVANGEDCNAVVGISGGVDSSVTAALCTEALGKDRVKGLLLPCGEQPDIQYAIDLCNTLGIHYNIMNIFDAVVAIDKQFPTDIEVSKQTMTNLPPRIRMATLYAYSQSVNGRVANTCNLSEDYIGYNTIFGDTVGDFSPLSNLTKTEVKEIGKVLGLPEYLVEKTPDDGLPHSQPDEEKFGFTYVELDKYIREGIIENVEHQMKIEELHNRNLFKLQPMPKFEYSTSE